MGPGEIDTVVSSPFQKWGNQGTERSNQTPRTNRTEPTGPPRPVKLMLSGQPCLEGVEGGVRCAHVTCSYSIK